jgi:hypothetical protein
MQNLNRPSKGRLITGIAFSTLGLMGLVISSLNSLSSIVFFWPADQLRLFRVLIILSISIFLLVGAARLFRDSHWWKNFIRSLPFIIGCFGCLGVIGTVANLYAHRQPHTITRYEANWFFGCLVGFLLCLFILRRRKKHIRKVN